MLAITYTPEDLRLLEAAEIAESSGRYSQKVFGTCGAPACMLGGYAWKHPESAAHKYATRADPPWSDYFAVLAEFGINDEGFDLLFSSTGCDGARTDGKKAAAYVRRFVRERAEARLR
jgi:hypothetical protein